MVAAAPILHVGEDICYRIPVMELAGFVVCRAPCSVEGIQSALGTDQEFSALTFHLDADPIPPAVLKTASSHTSLLVLFENTVIPYDAEDFDLVIPNQTPPRIWLQCLTQTLTNSRALHEYSRQLRREAAAVRAQSEDLRARMHRLLHSPVNLGEIWEAGADSSAPLALPPAHTRKRKPDRI